MSSCCAKRTGPGYVTPLDAYQNGPREKVIYVTCVRPCRKQPDYLATVDVDPNSKTYCRVVDRVEMTNLADEIHHSGWNVCSSCFKDPSKRRDKLVLPCLNSSRIYIVSTNPQSSKLLKTIEASELAKFDVSAPHTSHCLGSGHVMISCMGDAKGNAKGSFLLLNGETFEPMKLWNEKSIPFGYDFWYQPKFDILVSSEWGAPKAFQTGFNPKHLEDGFYGKSLHFWQFSTGKHLQSLNLEESTEKSATMPLEVRFLHNPDKAEGYVGCAFSSNVFRFYKEPDSKEWKCEEVISIPVKKVSNWSLGSDLPALVTDILISLDDRFLYVSAWAFGEVRQYGIGENAQSPPLVGRIRLGGLLSSNYSLEIIEDSEPEFNSHSVVKEKKIRGGSQMLQLSLDGTRLYVTNSLYSAWDQQFYPQMTAQGSQMLLVNVDTERGGLLINTDFVVDFGDEPKGPALAHEMRYPGGDCTSDIWL